MQLIFGESFTPDVTPLFVSLRRDTWNLLQFPFFTTPFVVVRKERGKEEEATMGEFGVCEEHLGGSCIPQQLSPFDTKWSLNGGKVWLVGVAVVFSNLFLRHELQGKSYNTGGKRKVVHVCVVYSLDIKEQYTHTWTHLSLSHTHKKISGPPPFTARPKKHTCLTFCLRL